MLCVCTLVRPQRHVGHAAIAGLKRTNHDGSCHKVTMTVEPRSVLDRPDLAVLGPFRRI